MATVVEDVIAAVGTAPGEAGIAVIRVSGPNCAHVVERVFRGRYSLKDVPSHRMVYGAAVDPDTEEVLDEVLAVRMQAPRSYTGEDVVEIHTHGGSAVVGRVLNAVVRAGARPAEPGEFTKRAFLNGRLDLSQAEAVMDLIRSKTDAARRMALEHLKGGLSAWVKQMREILLDVMAQIEVTIDYPEHDVEDVTMEQIREAVDRVREQIDELLASSRVGRLVREGVRTAIVGRPNVGKSSLLNALSGRERAIVTDVPGTTRDVVDEWVHVRGVAFQILDTAGIRATQDAVERIGVERSLKWVKEADLVLCVVDGSSPPEAGDLELLERVQDRPFLLVVNKIDLPQQRWEDPGLAGVAEDRVVRVSARTGKGVQQLADRMAGLVLGGQGVSTSSLLVANERHMALLKEAREDLDAAERAACEGWTVDVVAVDLRAAWEHLGEIVGERAGEELLNRIFSQFCLGK